MLELKSYTKWFKKYLTEPIVIFDLETTGTNVTKDHIIQFAALRIDPKAKGDIYKELEFKCKPPISIPEGASKVNGITNEAVAGCSAFSTYIDDIEKLFENAILAGFNLKRFDLKILGRELEESERHAILDNRIVYDAYSMFCKHNSRKLESAVKYYSNQEHEDAHDAMGDVVATAVVVASQLMRESSTPQELVAKFAEDEAKEDKEYLERWLIEDNGKYILNFGKYKGQALADIDKGFIKWVLNKDFPDVVKEKFKQYA
jgi:DNA polymerase-3 subunit epsilon